MSNNKKQALIPIVERKKKKNKISMVGVFGRQDNKPKEQEEDLRERQSY